MWCCGGVWEEPRIDGAGDDGRVESGSVGGGRRAAAGECSGFGFVVSTAVHHE